MRFALLPLLVLAAGCTGRMNESGRASQAEPDTLDARASSDPERCPVHDLPLQEGVVPIYYGLPRVVNMSEAFLDTLATRFPYENAMHEAGDVVILGQDHARVRFCPACREAQRAWLARHPDWQNEFHINN